MNGKTLTLALTIPSKEELEKTYNQYGNTISELARQYKTSNPTIRKWLNHHSITIKSHIQASIEANNKKRLAPPKKEILERLYKTNSIKGLENIFNVGQETIYLWLNHHEIEIKSLSNAIHESKQRRWNEMIPNKEIFIQVYDETKCLTALQVKFDLSRTSIDKLVKQYDIEVIQPQRSATEIEIFNILSSSSNDWKATDRSLINPYEIDMVNHTTKLGIEYCGHYWHSLGTGKKKKTYHLDKLNLCLSKGYNLITIFEGDDIKKIISLIKMKTGHVEKIAARQCTIQEVSPKDAKEFNEANHIHGHHGSAVYYGLYHNNDLVMLLSMGQSRFNGAYEWECARLTGKQGISVIGGASKLFDHFRKEQNPKSIITYSDRRFGEGLVYLNCGFERLENTEPNYWYFHKQNPDRLMSRIQFQKHKLVNMQGYDESLTEWEIMKSSGYDKIYDCGNAKYVWRNNK